MSYDKGFIICDWYEKLNGENFARYADQNFPTIFRKSYSPDGNVFLEDRDPSQNSALVTEVLNDMCVVRFCIASCSPDCHPIEKLFSLMEWQLRKEAINQNITHESYEPFVDRVKRALLNYPIEAILYSSCAFNGGKRW